MRSNESTVIGGERELTLTAQDGYQLAGRLFDGPAARATVVIHGATAVPQRFYAPFARYLARHGFRALTYDYRGIGGSRPSTLRGFHATMTDWARLDAASAQAHARTLHPRDPVVVVGHSFGVQLVGLVDELASSAAAVFFGGQFGYYGHWPLRTRGRFALLWHLGVPMLTAAYGYLPGRFGTGHDLPLGVARQWAKWCRSPDYLLGTHPDARHRYANFRVPTLSVGATDDPYAPRPAIDALLERLPTGSVIHRQLTPGDVGGRYVGHFGFFKEAFEDAIWAEARQFLTDVLDGHPWSNPRSAGAAAPSDPLGGLRIADVMADLDYGRT